MAYRIPRISPSALAATEHCPRFRPDGKDSSAAVDGIMMHEFAEQMVSLPRDQWDGWIATRGDASPEMKGMLELIASELRSIILEDMDVFPGFRLRMRAGKPRRTPLRPGLYPECELERGQGRHGYIDLLVVPREGRPVIVDYKSNRADKDFSLQLAAYALDVHRLCPAHEDFECRIIAPRLDGESQLSMVLSKDDLAKWDARIRSIEELADRSCNDDSVPGSPCDACQYCHWNGACRYQASLAGLACETVTTDVVTRSGKTGRETVAMSLASLVGPGGHYEGEVMSESTFTAPATPAQRGLRRACLKFLEVMIEAAKDDDRRFVGTYPDDQIRDMIPGFTVSRRRGRGSVDPSQNAAIRDAVMSELGMSLEDVFEVSSVDKGLLVESLVETGGMTKTKAEAAVKKIFERFTTPGAPVVYWTQKPPRRAIDAEFVDA